MARSCGTCEFFQPRIDPIADGECRINPPTELKKGGYARWPLVTESYWCGKYKQKNVAIPRGFAE